MRSFDHVIVGGGSAGAVLAARLSEDPARRVALIEAGGPGRGLLTRVPMGAVAMVSGRPRINNWAFETVPQPGLNGRKGYQPRGRVLGGSSALNAMLYVRGHRADFDAWAADGCTGWGWDDVLPLFKRAEANSRGGDADHGADGPLHVTDQFAPRAISQAFVDAGAGLQHPVTDDFNRGETAGVGRFQVTQFHDAARRGRRASTAAAYLHPVMDRPNLTVITRAQVTGLTFKGARATGVTYRRRGREEGVSAGEVILSAGSFGSPQLLQLSGIGRPEDLEPHGIAVRHALPGVGQNLQDHLDVILTYRTSQRAGAKGSAGGTFGVSARGAADLAAALLRWAWDGRSSAASPFAESAAFFHSSGRKGAPDVQLHFVVAMVENHLRTILLGDGYSCHVCALRPASRGRVGLMNADPLSAPRIDPGFLTAPEDADVLVRGTREALRIMAAPELAPWKGQPRHPLDVGSSDAEIEAFIRATADTIYHPVGTCAMGVQAASVVGPDLCVHGLDGLRIADASIMPRIPSGNTNAASIMIGEKAADLIRES